MCSFMLNLRQIQYNNALHIVCFISTKDDEKMIQCHCCISRGSSGEEVVLSERRLQEKDIEEPLVNQAEDLLGSAQRSAAASSRHGDNSDMEEEQEFVSSVVTQGRGRRRVHWDDQPDPKHSDKPEQGSVHRQDAQSSERSEDVQRVECGEATQTKDDSDSEVKVDLDNQRLSLNTVDTNGDQTSEDVEKATRNLQLCRVSDATPHLVDSESVRDDRVELPPSTSHMDGNPDSHQAASANLNISQVGLSKRGAAALRDLLSCHGAAAEADSIRLRLLSGLRRTFEEWCTAATQEFLYGTSRTHRGPPPKVSQDEQEEELDEDDLADDVADADTQGASAKDYEKLREEMQQQEQRVRGFYNGNLSSPGGVEDTSGEKVSSWTLVCYNSICEQITTEKKNHHFSSFGHCPSSR